MHNLFRSDKTGKIINLSLLKLYFSSRWYCDILRAMDYFHFAKVKCDVRIDDAISAINDKRNEDGMKKLAAHQPRQTHFEMEKQDNPGDGIH